MRAVVRHPERPGADVIQPCYWCRYLLLAPERATRKGLRAEGEGLFYQQPDENLFTKVDLFFTDADSLEPDNSRLFRLQS